MSVARLLRGRLVVALPLAVAFVLLLLFVPLFAGRGIRIDGSNITFYDFVMILLLIVPMAGWSWLASMVVPSGGGSTVESQTATTLGLFIPAVVFYGILAAVVGALLDRRRRRDS